MVKPKTRKGGGVVNSSEAARLQRPFRQMKPSGVRFGGPAFRDDFAVGEFQIDLDQAVFRPYLNWIIGQWQR